MCNVHLRGFVNEPTIYDCVKWHIEMQNEQTPHINGQKCGMVYMYNISHVKHMQIV